MNSKISSMRSQFLDQIQIPKKKKQELTDEIAFKIEDCVILSIYLFYLFSRI